MIDVEASRSALVELRKARRHNHRDAVHWIDALYRVYIIGLLAVIAVIAGSAVFGDKTISASEAATFVASATPWLGLAFAAAAAVGIRSGGRGGPLTLEAATVQHELLAPIEPGVVLREPALKQLRFLAFIGLCVGAVAGVLAMRPLPVAAAALIACSALAFAVAAVAGFSLALIFSGRRLGIAIANVLALVSLGWSVADIAAHTVTSPFSLLASLAFAPVTFNPLCLVPIALTAVALPFGLLGIGHTSIDDARRRAGLVTQLRFAVTLQDIRTVVQLRRQLAQETPRARPWIPLRRRGRLPAVWRRDWQSYLRFPLVRIARMVVLSMVAGLAIGATWNGVRPAFLIAALALYLVGYEVIEPLAQEIDHPSRWDGIPRDVGVTLLYHLPAAVIVMLVMVAIGAATSLVYVPTQVVTAEFLAIGVPTAVAAVFAAALSTVMGAPDYSKIMAGLGADMMGFVLVFRIAFPPALVAASLAPMFAAGVTPDELNLAKAQNVVGYGVLLLAAVFVYIRAQKPARV